MARMISCPDCGMMFRVEDDFEGKEANCPVCSRILIVPKPEAPVGARGPARPGGSAQAAAPAGQEPRPKPPQGPQRPAQKGPDGVPPPPAAFETAPQRRRAVSPQPAGWQLYRPVKRKMDPRWIWLSFGIFVGLVLLVGLVIGVVRLATTAVEPLPEQMRLARTASPAQPAPGPRAGRPAATRQRPRSQPVGPPLSPVAPVEPSRATTAAAPEGPIEGEAAGKAALILAALANSAVDAARPGMRLIDRGEALEGNVGGRRFTAVATDQATAKVMVPGRVELPDGLSLQTTNEWPLSKDLTLPPQTYLVFSDGAFRVVDVNRLRREASERDFYVRAARRSLSEAVRAQDWERAWKAIADLKARYPGSAAVEGLEADLRAAQAQVVIEVVNVSGHPIDLEVLQEGERAAYADLPPNARALFALKRGRYVVRYGAARLQRTEGLMIDRPQEWRIKSVVVPRGDDRPPSTGFARTARDLDMIGNPELRARMQAMERHEALAREVFLTTAQGKLEDAAKAGEWDRAWKLVEDVQTAYPDAPEAAALAARLRGAGSPVVIDVANLTAGRISVRMTRGPETVAAGDLPANDRIVFEVAPGRYSLRYGAPQAERTEAVTVERAQEWQIRPAAGPAGGGGPCERASRDLDLAGSLRLRARLRLREAGPGG
jgi:DNA-directed RNA polymerase subunit RPC12/RpoP